MAIMVPASINGLDGVMGGEIRLFEILRELLQDNYYVWYDAMINDRFPDFIIVGPDLGIIVLEVKDWEIGSIIEANTEYFTLRTTGRKPSNPFSQSRTYMRALLDILQKEYSLKQNEGRYSGRLKFNFGCGVVFTKIARKDFLSKEYGNVIDSKYLLFKDDLDHFQKNGNAECLLEKFSGMIPSDFQFPVLRENDVETIRMIISCEKGYKKNEQAPTPHKTEESRPKYESQKSPQEADNTPLTEEENKTTSGKMPRSKTKQPSEEEEDCKRTKDNFPKLKYLIITMAISAIFAILLLNIGTVVERQNIQPQNVSRGITDNVEPLPVVKNPTSSEDNKKKNKTESNIINNKEKIESIPTVQKGPKVEKAIKGNINKKGEMIYHLPGQAFYEKTKPEAWFRTEEETIAAGYRKAKDPLIKGNINKQGEKIYHMPGQVYYIKTTAEEWFHTEEDAQKAGYRKSKR